MLRAGRPEVVEFFLVLRAVETFLHVELLPKALALGTGKFAIDLGVNVWGLIICTLGFTLGAVLLPRKDRAVSLALR